MKLNPRFRAGALFTGRNQDRNAGENTATIRGVLAGKIKGPRRTAIVFNAAGALVVGGATALRGDKTCR